MAMLIECVPNISEGRDMAKLERVRSLFAGRRHVKLHGLDPDPDYNRSILTFTADDLDSLAKICISLTALCRELFDINKHSGVHPRIGIVDVMPFIPLKDISYGECSGFAQSLARRIAGEFHVPIYLYGECALMDSRVRLAAFRNKGYNKLRSLMRRKKDYMPDYGPSRPHKTLGAMAIGVRDTLIAYNVYLKTDDVFVAKKIASLVRESNSGLKGVKALGFFIKSKNVAQVSVNVCSYKETSLAAVYGEIARRARELGVEAGDSEIAGMAPPDALDGIDKDSIRLKKAELLYV